MIYYFFIGTTWASLTLALLLRAKEPEDGITFYLAAFFTSTLFWPILVPAVIWIYFRSKSSGIIK
jgi:hypothetical protein